MIALLLVLLAIVALFIIGIAVVKFLIWVAIILAIIWLIGFFALGVWAIYRIAKGWIALRDRRAIA